MASTLLGRLTIESGRNQRATSSPSSSGAVVLKPVEGFDWSKLTWGRPDSPPSVLCSYCSAVIPEDDVPLIMWNSKGYCVRFCETCQELFWKMRG